MEVRENQKKFLPWKETYKGILDVQLISCLQISAYMLSQTDHPWATGCKVDVP